MHSRNRRAGILIGKGMTVDEAMKEVKQVVEGVYSAKAALQLADKYEMEAPIIRAVNRVLFGNERPMQAVEDLMLRDSRIENSGLEW
jgi:glycerol-3-phosphate dehydrogenase (NAD(P)+)